MASYDYLGSKGMIPVGNLLAGALGVAVGLQALLMCMTVIAVGVSVVVATSRGVRSLPSRSTTTAAWRRP